MDDFNNKVAIWRSLPGQSRRDYYYKNLFESVITKAIERWKLSPHSKNEYDLLISLSGFSPETTIIAFKLLRPKSILVISSENASDSIDQISDRIVGKGSDQISSSKFFHESCDPTSPMEIYNLIRKRVDKDKLRGKKIRAIIDITGGKKVMSAAAALVAWQLDMPICYIESDYDPTIRQPIPGSEYLIFLDNPITLFGDEEMNKVLVLFQSGHYAEALDRYKELAERISEPSFARFMHALSRLYLAWCNVDLDALPSALADLKQRLTDPSIRSRLKEGDFIALNKQIEFIERLAQNDVSAKLLCFYLLGRHYHELKRYDFACLFFYRTIEGCFRERLESQYRPFDSSNPDYSILRIDIAQLKQRYLEISSAYLKTSNSHTLPNWPLGYINLAIILQILDDPLLKNAGFPIKAIGQLSHVAAIRNNSILAHGFNCIKEKDSNSIMKISERILDAYWQLSVKDETFGKNLKEIYDNLKFVRFENTEQ